MKKFKAVISIVLVISLLTCLFTNNTVSAAGSTAVIDVDGAGEYKPISQNLFGIFFEDINFAADGGLSSNLIRNNSFEQKLAWAPDYDCRMTGWEIPLGEAFLQQDNPMSETNKNYLHANTDCVARNYGYPDKDATYGIYLEKGVEYDFSFYARSTEKCEISASFTNEKEKSIVSASFGVEGGFKKYSTVIKPSQTDYTILQLSIPQGADVDFFMLVSHNSFGYGDDMWKNSTFRADLVQALKELNPAFMRFPGGCLVEGAYDWDYAYNWKYTIGPLEDRVQIPNIWGYNQSMAVGFYEYFCLCDYLDAEPLPIVHAGLMCQGRGDWKYDIDSPEMEQHIQDIMDLIEYANGSTDTYWGAIRAENGHPEPFNMKYLGVGNENWMENYWDRFDVIYNAVKREHPEITIISSAGTSADGPEHDYAWELVNEKYVDTIVDEHYYIPTWWPYVMADKYDSYSRDGAKVFVGEYAVHRSGGDQITKNNLQVAVDEAVHMINLVRNGDIVEMACYAPLFAREGYTQWAPNLIWFNSNEVVRTPSYYVQQLYMNNTGSGVIKSTLSGKTDDLFQVTSINPKTKQIYVNVVNSSGESKKININLNGFRKLDTVAEQRYIGSGLFNLANRFGILNGVVSPRYQKVAVINNKISQSIPPHSLSIFCISYDGENTYAGLGSATGYKAGSVFENIILELVANFVIWFTETDLRHAIEAFIKNQQQ